MKNDTDKKDRRRIAVDARRLAILGMLTALSVVLNRFASIHTAGWIIGFAFVPVAFAAMLYGPAAGAAVGGLADLIGALLFPFGPYFVGFTVTAALKGAVYGWFLHRDTVEYFPHFLPVVGINCVLIGLFVDTLWVSILYESRTYWGWFVYRLPEYAMLVPVNLIFLPLLVPLRDALKKSFRL